MAASGTAPSAQIAGDEVAFPGSTPELITSSRLQRSAIPC